MTAIVLHTVNATTDAFAGLSSASLTYSTVKLQWTNVSQSTADFRILDKTGSVHGDQVSIGGGSAGSITVGSLLPGTSTDLYLERYEIDTWIKQTSTSSLDYVLASTPATSFSVATGSTSAKVTWPSPVTNSNYTLTYNSTNSSTSDTAIVSVSGTTAEAFLSGLTQGVTYDLNLTCLENGNTVVLATKTFMTSTSAQMTLTGPFASYIGIDWSASVDGQGSVYRIVNRDNAQGDGVLAESSTETNAVVQGLSPGSEYNIVLQRLELDNTWSDQNEVITNTLISSMSLSSVASKTLELTWTSLYAGAQYEVFYTPSGGNSIGNGQTTDIVNILRSISPGMDYTIELIAYELGEAVGLAKLLNRTNNQRRKIIETKHCDPRIGSVDRSIHHHEKYYVIK